MKEYSAKLKKEINTFAFDLNIYCKGLLEGNTFAFPDELKDVEKHVKKYASLNPTEPNNSDFNFRAYIFDNQLRLLFAMESNSGKIPQEISRMLHKSKSDADYAYGSGEKYDSVFFTDASAKFCNDFNSRYGFIPVENFILPIYLCFWNNELRYSQHVSPWQFAFILSKYKRYNLVNWEHTVKFFDFNL